MPSYYGYGQPGVYQTYGKPGYAPSDPSAFQSWANQYVPGGFAAWQQRQFSSQPFAQGDIMAIQPSGQLPAGFGSSSGGGGLSQYDPRTIMQGDAFKRLMELSNLRTASTTARGIMDPAISHITGQLQNPAPLGTGRGELARESGFAGVRAAGETARRRIDEESGRFGALADPTARAFSREMTRFGEAGAFGEVNRGAQEVDLLEQQMNQEFRRGLAATLSSMGLGLGGLEAQEMGINLGAATAAGQLESFARNAWAEIFGRLALAQQGGGGIQYSVEGKGLGRDFGENDLRQMMYEAGYFGFPDFPVFSFGG